ncbi:hypothetical protein K0M31_016834, partial [Melipona bicolor]
QKKIKERLARENQTVAGLTRKFPAPGYGAGIYIGGRKTTGPGVRLLKVGVPDPYSRTVFTDTLVLASVAQETSFIR